MFADQMHLNRAGKCCNVEIGIMLMAVNRVQVL